MRLRPWRKKFDQLATQFAVQHFGGWEGVIRLFSSMKRHKLTWDDRQEIPFDVLFIRKMADEYHGLERHANQYHVTEEYEYAYHHWLMAASWRNENMKINKFKDEKHKIAIEFDLRCAFYNAALHDWHWNSSSCRRRLPKPYHFGIDPKVLQKKDVQSNYQIEQAVHKASE
jgi:hypothetical protein